MAKINDEQFLDSFELMWTELCETETEKLRNHNALNFAEPELDIRHYSKKELGTQAASENEKSISTLRRTQVPERTITVSEQRISGFRRCGGLSEY